MKTKITLLIGIVALVTLSFTFSNLDMPLVDANQEISRSTDSSAPVGGFIVDEIVK